MKGLITGGAGFIGSHLAEALLHDGHEVYVIDDLSTGSIENIEPLKHYPSFHHTIGSVMDSSLMTKLVDECDVIFHLAAAVGVKLAVERPVHTVETNLDGTGKVLRLANERRKKVILASTSEVYGDSHNVPFREDANITLYPTTKSRWSYAWSKAIAEILAMAYWHEHQLPVVILRLFNTVGPGQTGRYGMVIPRFVGQAMTGEHLTIYGNGEQSRCFAHVDDVVRGIIDLSTHPDAVGQIFNIGNDQEVTIKALAQLITEFTESTSELTYVPYDQVYGEGFEDMQRRMPNLNRIRSLIGYRTTNDLPAIVRSVIEHQGAGPDRRP